MKRKPRFMIAAISAAITFAALAFTVGPMHHRHCGHHQMEQCQPQPE